MVEDIRCDNLTFRERLFSKVFNEIEEGIREGEVRDGDYFVRHEDGELSALAGALMINPYKLSDGWSKRQIYVPPRESKIEEDIRQKLLRFKESEVSLEQRKLTNELKEEIDETTREENLHGHSKLNQVRKRLNEPLGRIL